MIIRTKLRRSIAVLAGILVIGGAWAQSAINVVVNGQQVQFNNKLPTQERGRVLVPLRGVLEQLGAYVGWDQATQTVTASKGDLDLKLPIGSRTARVNGNDVQLDVPAQIVDGTTMVPLRFISEALGANVQWVSATQTVQINTVVTDVARNTNPVVPEVAAPPAMMINTFSADNTGYVRSGATLTFTLVGTPGGVATFQIPGVTGDLPMRETQPGTYVGSWKSPPGSDKGMALNETTAIAHLAVGGREQIAQTTSPFSIDSQPPVISSMRPDAVGEITNSKPNISVRIDDGPGSGVDPNSVKISLDGQDITSVARISSNRVSFRPDADLTPGPHKVEITANDLAGNTSTSTWSFNIAAKYEGRREMRFTSPSSYDAGKEINFSLDADPGSAATYSIGYDRNNLPMTETTPGHYEGKYTIQDGDSFSDEPVRAHIHTKDGKDYIIDASDRVTMQTGVLRQPHVNFPAEDATVNSPLILKGKAAPFAEIHIHVAYSSLVMLNQVRVRGTVGDYSVEADEKGNFRSPDIDIDKVHGANAHITVTAYAIDANGKKSAITTLNLNK